MCEKFKIKDVEENPLTGKGILARAKHCRATGHLNIVFPFPGHLLTPFPEQRMIQLVGWIRRKLEHTIQLFLCIPDTNSDGLPMGLDLKKSITSFHFLLTSEIPKSFTLLFGMKVIPRRCPFVPRQVTYQIAGSSRTGIYGSLFRITTGAASPFLLIGCGFTSL